MRKRWIVLGVGGPLLLGVLLWVGDRQLWLARCRAWSNYHAQHAGEGLPTRINPDYDGAVIPPNIAPLNFRALTAGRRYYVRIAGRGRRQPAIELLSRSPSLRIPERPWRRLLEANVGRDITIDLCVALSSRRHERHNPICLSVAREPIDPYLVNRVIPPLYNYWEHIEVRQRDLRSFRERTVVHNRAAGNACLNCHSFRENRADRMTLGVRSGTVGSSTVMVCDGVAEKVGTKFGYTAWHPSGLLAAYSVNEVRQFFHWAGQEVRDVVDLDSGLAYYDLRGQRAWTTPGLNRDDRLETYPTWTPDGQWLYFCSAPFPWRNRHRIPPENYRQCRYDLCRISYDVETKRWGEPEVVLPAAELGKSLLLPRISPDGRFLLFCACDYGCFPIYQPSSDLYLLDLRTGRWRRLDVLNSPRSESWHCWSSNGRWVAFSSKRQDGLFTRTYLSYVDASGKTHQPFVVPQKDPASYDSCLKTYTVPELILEPVPVRPQRLAQTIIDPTQTQVDSPISFEPKAQASAPEAAWQTGRR